MKRLGIFLIFAVLLAGCAGKNAPDYRVVTGVQVQYQRQDTAINRTYTKPASIQSVLTYLRILRPFGPATPEGASDSTCQITLHYSQGPDTVFLQQGQSYLRENEEQWEYIDAGRASLLYPLLLLLPSD